MPHLRETVAKNIRDLRVRAGISQAELARKAGLTDVYISRVEKQAKNLTLDSVEQIARALGVSVSVLIGREPTPLPSLPPERVEGFRHAILVLEACLARE